MNTNKIKNIALSICILEEKDFLKFQGTHELTCGINGQYYFPVSGTLNKSETLSGSRFIPQMAKELNAAIQPILKKYETLMRQELADEAHHYAVQGGKR